MLHGLQAAFTAGGSESGILRSCMGFLGMSRKRCRIAGLVLCAGVGGLPRTDARADALLIRPPGRGSAARLAAALQKELQRSGGPIRVLELSLDAPADAARLSRETQGGPLLFAVGPDAAELAGQAHTSGVVSLGVPNPAQIKTPGIYVSIYPRLEGVLEALRTDLGVKRAGLLFSPAQNREIGVAFIRAGQAAGVAIQPLPVGSSGELIRRLRSGLSDIDVLLLPVDPILFDRRSLQYVVDESRKAGVPTVGFLEGLEGLGVTLAVVADLEAVAQAAVGAAADPVTVGKRRLEVEGWRVVVSREAAAAVGLSKGAIDALQAR
jgi:hypothetical protein